LNTAANGVTEAMVDSSSNEVLGGLVVVIEPQRAAPFLCDRGRYTQQGDTKRRDGGDF